MAGLIFTTESIKAILLDHKTQTRRLVDMNRNGYYNVGGRGLARERWAFTEEFDNDAPRDVPPSDSLVWYEADAAITGVPRPVTAGKMRSPLFMPNWTRRIEYVIQSIELQNLHDATNQDAIAEGVGDPALWPADLPILRGGLEPEPRDMYAYIWDQINGDGGNGPNRWAANPPNVLRIKFEVINVWANAVLMDWAADEKVTIPHKVTQCPEHWRGYYDVGRMFAGYPSTITITG